MKRVKGIVGIETCERKEKKTKRESLGPPMLLYLVNARNLIFKELVFILYHITRKRNLRFLYGIVRFVEFLKNIAISKS